jgi:hypothetical protein
MLIDHLMSYLYQPFAELQDLIPDDGHYCFLAIDEAVSMTLMHLTEFRQILSHLHFPKFRGLLFDTDLKVTRLTTRKDLIAAITTSVRILPLPALTSIAPFTAMPQDVFLLYDKSKAKTHNDILSSKISKTFGITSSYL